MPALPSKAVVFRNHTSAARTARIGIFTGGGMIPPSSSPQPSWQCGSAQPIDVAGLFDFRLIFRPGF
jgi:hypothetical protein